MSVRGVAEIDITTTSFLGALALLTLGVVLLLVLVLRTRLGRFTRLGRTITLLVTSVLVLVAAARHVRVLGPVRGAGARARTGSRKVARPGHD